MINKENLNQIYEMAIDKQELTTKELNKIGFNSKDLKDLIEKEILERIKRGYYSFKDVDNLFLYGKKLIVKREKERAIECFNKCYQLNPNHPGVCFQMFIRCIKIKDYEQAFKYFEVFNHTNNNYYNLDSNYYLYLLSMITKIPEKYWNYVKSLKIKDIEIDKTDKRYDNIPVRNKIRLQVLNQQLILAIKQFNDLMKQKSKQSIQDIVINSLLSQAIENQNKIKQNILELVNQKQYEELINYLENMQKYCNLSISNKYTLILVKDLLAIRKTGIIPSKTLIKTNNFFAAIDYKNYELAYSLNLEYLKQNNMPNDNANNIILKEIKDLISNQKTIIEEPKKEEKIVNNQSDFALFVQGLINNIDKTFSLLTNYLTGINKKEYEFLIIDLIKISLLEKDIAFTKPMITLNYIMRDSFKLDISEYIQEFYENLAQNNFAKARIYLDIIAKSNKLEPSLIKNLEQVLANTENIVNCKENKVLKEEPKLTPSKPSLKKEINQTKNQAYNDEEFINQQLFTLYENGIVLLKPMDNERIEKIHEIVEKIRDVVAFTIGSSSKKQVFLKYNPYINPEKIDSVTTINKAKEAYRKGDYDTCITLYRQVLEFKSSPKAHVYAYLGLAYFKKRQKDIAIDYLTIATEISKNEDGKFDFSDLILSLKGLAFKTEQKPRVKMLEEDFSNDMHNYYGIEKIEEIVKLISNGYTLDEAIKETNLTEEEKLIVALILAREYYAIENYSMGDKYVKIVEKTKNKTKFINNLLEEIKINKKFYKNRLEVEQCLLLKKGKINYV